jgi:hypothetical protein
MIIIVGLLLAMPANAAALTVEEILLLKQNGVSEQTIQMMLESQKKARSDGSENSRQSMGVKTIIRSDGRGVIVYSTGGETDGRLEEERLKEERAWEMLRHLIVDTRATED